MKTLQVTSHKTKSISLKTSEIDIEMIPVIEWLNSFDEIYTRWCCQGNDMNQKPYVIFYCESQMVLTEIVSQVEHYANVTVEYYKPSNTLRYNMEFHDRTSFKSFVEGLKI